MNDTVREKTAVEIKPSDWAGTAGDRWLANLDRYEQMLAPIGEALLDHAALGPGMTVAEIGCGGGAVTREVAARVGPGGAVVGIDISPVLTELATERARAAGLGNLRLVTGDAAATMPADAPFDRLLSRFGIMFFAEPVAAFTGLRRLLRSGGRADFAVWAPPSENPSISMLAQVAGNYLILPKPVPHAPGPFALDDPDYFSELLTSAGFTDPRFEKWTGPVAIGGGTDAAGAADFLLGANSMADVLAEQPETIRSAIRTDLAAMFVDHEVDGRVMLTANVFLVTASG